LLVAPKNEIWSAPISISLGHAQNLSPNPAGTVTRAAETGAADRFVSYSQLQHIRDGGQFGAPSSPRRGEAAELSKLVAAYVNALEANDFDQRLRAIEAKGDATRP
jgi:hypothetical protein